MDYPKPLAVARLLEALVPATEPENYPDADIPEAGEITYAAKQIREHAQLIAAAPELLDTLYAVKSTVHFKNFSEPLQRQLLEAIAKAEGRA